MSLVKMENSLQRENLGLKGVTFREGAREYKQFPALLIGMLGVCERYRNRGLGLHILKVTIGRARAVSRSVGCRFVTVDSDKTDAALGLYRRAEFQQVEGQERESTVL